MFKIKAIIKRGLGHSNLPIHLYLKVCPPLSLLFTQLFPLQVLEDKLPLYFPRDKTEKFPHTVPHLQFISNRIIDHNFIYIPSAPIVEDVSSLFSSSFSFYLHFLLLFYPSLFHFLFIFQCFYIYGARQNKKRDL